jgi:hypothetical protein
MWDALAADRYNGAWYYSQEIVRNIIPNVKTRRNWVTVNIPGRCLDNSIVFIHNNLHPELYNWLRHYNNLILVCGTVQTAERMSYLAPSLYLPLSIDVEDVLQYKTEKRLSVAFAGRASKAGGAPKGIKQLSGLPREELLAEMAKYRKVYAVGRTAIEAKALGCKVLPYDPRFPDPSIWQVIDNREAAAMLQKALDENEGPAW